MARPHISKRRWLRRSEVDALGLVFPARHLGGGRAEGMPLTPNARAAASNRIE